MIKIGNRVSLFENMGAKGTVVGMRPRKTKTWHAGGASANTWDLVIQWDDGTKSVERIGAVMRID